VLPIDLAQGRPAEIEATASVTYGANDIEPLLIESLEILSNIRKRDGTSKTFSSI
jgi:hypothetical protein